MDQSQHPGALDRLNWLEAKTTASGEAKADDVASVAPAFDMHINDVDCEEGNAAVFECTVAPVSDASMKIGERFAGCNCYL
jgi:hypothetical protein